MYERQQWEKVLNNIHRKSELDKSREFANQIMTRFQHLERERARTEREVKKVAVAAGTNNADKQKTVASSGVVRKDASSNLNAGVKRAIEEVGKGPTTSVAKKISIADVRNPMPNPNPKSAALSVPARNGPPSNVGEKKSTTSSVGTSIVGPSPSTSTTATATAPTKKPPSSSGFFKSLSKPAEAVKAPTKFVLPESHPMVSLSGIPN